MRAAHGGGFAVGRAGGGGVDGGEQRHRGVHLRVHGGAVPVPRRRPPPRGEQMGQRVHHRAHHRTIDVSSHLQHTDAFQGRPTSVTTDETN